MASYGMAWLCNSVTGVVVCDLDVLTYYLSILNTKVTQLHKVTAGGNSVAAPPCSTR